jgi:hypothetical protein
MTSTLLLGIGVLVAAVAGLALLEVLVRRPDVGAALVLGVTVLKAALLDRAPSLTLPGGINLQLHDVVLALLLAAGIARFLRVRRLTGFDRWLLLFAFLLLLSLVRGALAFGGQQSVSEFRLFSPFISTAIYFASFPPSSARNDRIGRIWLVLTIPMVILVCIRWVQNLAGVSLGVPAEEFGADAALRVINGPYAFLVATSVMLTTPFWQRRDERARKLRRVGGVLLLLVVLLNRRTIWITLLIGVAVAMLHKRKLGHRMVLMLVAAAIVTVGVFLVVPSAGTETAAGGSGPTVTNPLSTGTLDWRIEGWSKLLGQWSRNPVDWVVGQPFGTGFAREIQGSGVAASSDAHNFYITTLLRTGAIGMLALIVLTVGLLRALWRRAPTMSVSGLLSPEVFPVLLVAQFVWFLTWMPGNEQGIINGLAVALVSARVQSRRAVRSSPAQRTTQGATAVDASGGPSGRPGQKVG